MSAAATISRLQLKLQTVSTEYQRLQGELQIAVDGTQRLEAQLTENETVKKEFAQLKPENQIYKMIGPVLVKQDQAEAKSNVETRLAFIKSEIKRLEEKLKEINGLSEQSKSELVEIQAALQQAQAPTSQTPKTT